MKYLFAALILVFSQKGIAQEKNKVTLRKNGFRTTFVVEGEDASKFNPNAPMKTLLEVMKRYDKSYEMFRKGKNQSVAAQVLGFAGGFLMGYPLGASLGGGEFDGTMFAVGTGITVVSIPISISSSKNINKAIEIYNNDGMIASRTKREVFLAFSSEGVGVRVSF